MPANTTDLEKRLWDAADELRANSKLKSSEYSVPVSDARSSELEIRQKLIEAGVVDVMIAVGSNFFYTVTLHCTLWFLDKGKTDTTRKNKILFIDARHIYQQYR